MSKALLIIAQQGYQDRELAGTRKGLGANYEITIGAKETGTCTGKLGGKEEATVSLRDVDVKAFDRIAFIGGPGAATLASDSDALKVANDAYRAEVPLGAICIAPTILAKAHVLDGKRATVWNLDEKQAHILTEYGAEFTDETVTVDGLVVTGNGPDAAEEFGAALAAL